MADKTVIKTDMNKNLIDPKVGEEEVAIPEIGVPTVEESPNQTEDEAPVYEGAEAED